jgi:CrcB protein
MAAAMLLVAVGSALGGAARFGTYLLLAPRLGPGFPWWTLAVNVMGSFIIGWFSAAAPTSASNARHFIMTGVCGGFTTFSALSLDTLLMVRQGDPHKALFNVAASLMLCGLAVSAGWALGARK